ncbi:MAG: serine/threonine protein kinase [Kiritimatiellae bacterium]|nr:serine/threonine protein kinase [Kiritimatiellia bacterium]
MNDEISDWLASRVDDTPPPVLEDGAIVGDFTVVGFLGRGGSGEVYRAEHRLLKMPVALKVLYRGDEAGKARFAREAEILANNQCPGFPRFFSYGEADGRLYLATELLEERPLPSKEGEIAKFIQQVASAVGELHKLGYVHRDIKPSNILWRIGGTRSVASSVPVLIDLGLAKPLSDGHSPNLDTLSIDGGKPVGVGTPGYAAPEQFVSGEIGFSADIHALGVLANECFGGNPPKGWAQIIRRATSSIRAQRPSDVTEFINVIKSCRRRKMSPAIFVIAAAIIAVFVIVLQRRTRSMQKEIDIPPSPPNVEKSSSMRGAPTKLGDIISYDKGYKRINELPADASADQIIEAAIADAKDAYARQVEKTEKAKQQPNIQVAHNLILLPAVHGSYVNTFLRERGFNADMRKKYQPVIDELCRLYRREWEAHRCGMPYFVVIEPKTERRPKSLLDDSSFEVERIH